MNVLAETISEHLEQETRLLHQRSLHGKLRRELRGGTLPRGVYAAWLSQRLCIHRAIADTLDEVVAGEPVLDCVRDHQHVLMADLDSDLEFLGVDPAATLPAPPAAELIASIEHTAGLNPIAVVGVCHVLHVTRDVAPAEVGLLRGGFGLSPGLGTLYVDAERRGKRGAVCAIELAHQDADVSRIEIHTLVAAARTTYALLQRLDDALCSCAVVAAEGVASRPVDCTS